MSQGKPDPNPAGTSARTITSDSPSIRIAVETEGPGFLFPGRRGTTTPAARRGITEESTLSWGREHTERPIQSPITQQTPLLGPAEQTANGSVVTDVFYQDVANGTTYEDATTAPPLDGTPLDDTSGSSWGPSEEAATPTADETSGDYEETEDTPAPKSPVAATPAPSLVPVPPPLPSDSTSTFSTVLSQTTLPVSNGETALPAPTVCDSLSDPLTHPHATPVSPPSSSRGVPYRASPSLPPSGWGLSESWPGLGRGVPHAPTAPATLAPSFSSTLSCPLPTHAVSDWRMDTVLFSANGDGGGGDDDDNDDDLLSGSASVAEGDALIVCSDTDALPLQTLPDSSATVLSLSHSVRDGLRPSRTLSPVPPPTTFFTSVFHEHLETSLPLSCDCWSTAATAHIGGQSSFLPVGGAADTAGPTESAAGDGEGSGFFRFTSAIPELPPASMGLANGVFSGDSVHASLHLLQPSSSGEAPPGGSFSDSGSMVDFHPSLSPSAVASRSPLGSFPGDADRAADSALLSVDPLSLPAGSPSRSPASPLSDVCISVTATAASTPSPVPFFSRAAPLDPPALSPTASPTAQSTAPFIFLDSQVDSSASGSTLYIESPGSGDLDQEWDRGQTASPGSGVMPSFTLAASPTTTAPFAEPTASGADDGSGGDRPSSFYFESENGTDVVVLETKGLGTFGGGEEESGSGSLYDNETSSDFSIPEYAETESEEAPKAGKAPSP